MLRILILSLMLMAAIIGTADGDPPTAKYLSSIGPNPKISVWNSPHITQISFTNGDLNNPELIVLLCDRDSKTMFFRYRIKRNGINVSGADFFTIQRYPAGTTVMNYPYFPPAKVIYDSGMGLNKDNFSTVTSNLLAYGNYGFVFTLEEITGDYGARTKAWSSIYPSSVVKRDLTNQDITGCLYTDSRIMLSIN